MIDVLLATYNGARYLPEQAESLKNQIGADYRVIVQDDGSADGTQALISALCAADPRFSQGTACGRHLGAVGNFISLMGQSTAAYCALCDQDDVWAKERLFYCLDAMHKLEARHGAQTPLLVHSDARLIDGEGNQIAGSFFRRQGWNSYAVELPRLLVQNNATGCTMLMNAPLRDLVVRYGKPETMFMHDWFIVLTAAAFGRVRCLPEQLVDYRQHGANVMGASRAGLLSRAAGALANGGKARERIALTYRHARAFQEAYGEALPAYAAGVVKDYLATEHMRKVPRVWRVLRGGYHMQSPVTRVGQILFG